MSANWMLILARAAGYGAVGADSCRLLTTAENPARRDGCWWWSRRFPGSLAAVVPPSRQTMDFVAGMRQQLPRSAHELWCDNEAGIGRRGRLTEPATATVGTLGSRLVQLKPYDSESKGMVERQPLSGNPVPAGRHFASPQDFND
ncbi:hypothetical protein [Mycolicibacterium hodleri]|uniref:hypothetical protein n=1 Tax=Mycolicibacterium hodleri TaxID=49897 RepID=UPI001F1C5FA0|nr:hypothetical protein [Mycolicibacterium hodleri]